MPSLSLGTERIQWNSQAKQYSVPRPVGCCRQQQPTTINNNGVHIARSVLKERFVLLLVAGKPATPQVRGSKLVRAISAFYRAGRPAFCCQDNSQNGPATLLNRLKMTAPFLGARRTILRYLTLVQEWRLPYVACHRNVRSTCRCI